MITTEIGWDENQGFAQADIAQYALDAALDGIEERRRQDILLRPVRRWLGQVRPDERGRHGRSPPGTAIHNLTTLLADTGATAATFTPGSLGYTLSGTTASDNALLMQKSDGSYWLSLWNENDAAHNVTVTLPAAARFQVFDPLDRHRRGVHDVGEHGNCAAFPIIRSWWKSNRRRPRHPHRLHHRHRHRHRHRLHRRPTTSPLRHPIPRPYPPAPR